MRLGEVWFPIMFIFGASIHIMCLTGEREGKERTEEEGKELKEGREERRGMF